MELTITSEPAESGVTRLRLKGAVDLVSKDELFATGRSALQESSGLLLNLADVNFMDSTGIGVLIDLSREAEDLEKSFAIQEPSARVQRVLTLTGLQNAWTQLPPAE